jgi:hypothetical protein
VAQLSQACKVIPLDPSLHDLAISNTIDCDVFSIHGFAGGEVRTHRSVLGSTEIVPHRDFFRFRKYVEDYFLGVWKNLKFASKKFHEICAAPDRGITGGKTVALEVLSDNCIEPTPVLGVDCVNKGLDGLFRIHEGSPRKRIGSRKSTRDEKTAGTRGHVELRGRDFLKTGSEYPVTP